MINELLLLFYIVSVLVSIGTTDEVITIDTVAIKDQSFYVVLLMCFIPVLNLLVTAIMLDDIKKGVHKCH